MNAFVSSANRLVTKLRWLVCLVAIVLATKATAQVGDDDSPEAEFRGLSAAESAALAERLNRTIIEQGVVESSQVLELRSEVQGEAVIRFLIEDRSVVTKGDLLLAFDDRQLQQELLTQQQQRAAAAAAVAGSEAELAAVREQGKTAIPLAERQLHVTRLARERLLGEAGELALEERRLERQLAVARTRVEVLEKEPDSAPRANRLRALSLEEARGELANAEESLLLLRDHLRPQAAAERELAVLEAERELQQVTADVEAETRECEVQLAAARARLAVEQAELERLEGQQAASEVRAPHDGVVLHAQPPSTRGQAPALTAGATVRERQLLLTMPDLAALQVRVRVHESKIARVAIGNLVTLQCDALPNKTFSGEVIDIGKTPEPTTWFSDVVEYPVIVQLQSPPAAVRVGMTTMAEIATGKE